MRQALLYNYVERDVEIRVDAVIVYTHMRLQTIKLSTFDSPVLRAHTMMSA